MEYLMTYGWAILIISLALGVLYSLGVLNPKNFTPRVPPGSCFVFRPNGPRTTDMLSLQGTCGYLPMYVGSFNGVDSYVSGAIGFPWGGVGYEVTFEAWIKVEPVVIPSTYTWNYTNAGIVTFDDHWDGGFLGVDYVGTAGTLSTSYYILTYYYNDPRTTGPYNDFGIWNHIVAQFKVLDSNTVNFKVYKNGAKVQDSNIVRTGFGNVTGKGDYFNLGKNNVYRGVYFKGMIAEVRIYNTALSQQEIQYLYQQGLGGGPIHLQNLVAWWPLNGDAKDYSGNNNHGTIHGVSFVQNYNPP
jgi:hypothetical protein